MYVPPHFQASDEATRQLLKHHGAADLVTATTLGLVATHLPFVFDPGAGEHGSLLGHVARANPHWTHEVSGEALVIMRGPEAYISPSWYPSKADHGRVVPTWNYLTAHVYGQLIIHDDPEWVEALVRRLTTKHESPRDAPWSVDDAPPAFIAAQLREIVGIEVQISRIEAKSKWSQNRSAADREGVAGGLAAEGRDGEADWVRRPDRNERLNPPRIMASHRDLRLPRDVEDVTWGSTVPLRGRP